MANALFGQMGNNMTGGNPQFTQMMKQFQQFRQSFQGDPRQKVQELLNNGKLSQEQFNQVYGIAQNFMGMMK